MEADGEKVWDELLEWADATEGASFIIKMNIQNIETRWRVCLWTKPEGESLRGKPAEGYGKTGREAVRNALGALKDNATLKRRTGVNWYVPPVVAALLEDDKKHG